MHQSRLNAGDKAPAFEGIDQNGNNISLKDYTGRKVVLYFYPKDNTPTCTKQTCNLRDNYNSMIARGYVVLGISPDGIKSHQKFARKYNIPFSLVADESKKIISDYDVWGNKVVFGIRMQGVVRTTFVIDENGIIEEVIRDVKSGQHASQILKS